MLIPNFFAKLLIIFDSIKFIDYLCNDIRFLKEMTNQRPLTERRIATVGTFDGLHKGHWKVISTLRSEAQKRGLRPMLVCFDRHPLETVAPERAPLLIQSPSERTNTLFKEGISILTLEFTPAVAAMSAREWLRKMHEDHNVDVLVTGYDNTFGSDGISMNLADYKRLGAEVGVEVIEAPFEPRAASSAIRRLLREGKIGEANSLLGRKFTVFGEVVAGKRMGHSIGFPTANVKPSYRALMPLNGVYAVEVEFPDGKVRQGVANIGTQPTLANDAPMRLEVHIPGFDGNLYGSRLGIRFLRRLRDEIKFNSISELKTQIVKDIRESLSGE